MTLIAADGMESGTISDVSDRLAAARCVPGEISWLEPDKAVDIAFDGPLDAAREALAPLETQFDIVVQLASARRKKLLVSDMDSTMISVECIDELADYAGLKPQIAAITERAMAGELDFADALKERVALLGGLDEAVIEQCLAERVKPMAGAETLIRTMTAHHVECILVSGGFTAFAKPVAEMIGFSEMHANLLEIDSGKLTGRLLGAIVDADAKRAVLNDAAKRLGIGLEQTLAVGDGANDMPMICAAVAAGGLGVGYHPRPKLAAAANFSIRFNDLTALLYAQGISRSEWHR